MDYKDLKKGMKIKIWGITGILLTDSEYISTGSFRLYYANVRWENGTIDKGFMLCREGLEIVE